MGGGGGSVSTQGGTTDQEGRTLSERSGARQIKKAVLRVKGQGQDRQYQGC